MLCSLHFLLATSLALPALTPQCHSYVFRPERWEIDGGRIRPEGSDVRLHVATTNLPKIYWISFFRDSTHHSIPGLITSVHPVETGLAHGSGLSTIGWTTHLPGIPAVFEYRIGGVRQPLTYWQVWRSTDPTVEQCDHLHDGRCHFCSGVPFSQGSRTILAVTPSDSPIRYIDIEWRRPLWGVAPTSWKIRFPDLDWTETIPNTATPVTQVPYPEPQPGDPPLQVQVLRDIPLPLAAQRIFRKTTMTLADTPASSPHALWNLFNDDDYIVQLGHAIVLNQPPGSTATLRKSGDSATSACSSTTCQWYVEYLQTPTGPAGVTYFLSSDQPNPQWSGCHSIVSGECRLVVDGQTQSHVALSPETYGNRFTYVARNASASSHSLFGSTPSAIHVVSLRNGPCSLLSSGTSFNATIPAGASCTFDISIPNAGSTPVGPFQIGNTSWLGPTQYRIQPSNVLVATTSSPIHCWHRQVASAPQIGCSTMSSSSGLSYHPAYLEAVIQD
jgi:hypothetical protein